MSLTAETIERLRAACADTFRVIAGAADLAALNAAPPAVPAVYVMAEGRQGGPNRLATIAVDQKLDVQVGLVIVTSNRADPRGGAAARDVEALAGIALDALVGWTPPSADAPLTLLDGETVELAHGCVWWRDTYGTSTHIRKT